jgi:hypothetical protein
MKHPGPPVVVVPLGDRRRSDWRSASSSTLRPLAGGHDSPPTRLAMRADAEALHLRFTARATRLTARMQNDGDPLYLEDVVEVFLWPTGEQPAVYLEYEVSPLGRDLCLLCCQRDGRRSAWRPWGSPQDRPSCHVTVQGGAQRPLAAIRSWRADIRIPFSALAGIAPAPRPGDRWRANCYRIDHAGGLACHSAWSPPPFADFHHLDSFGTIHFTGHP